MEVHVILKVAHLFHLNHFVHIIYHVCGKMEAAQLLLFVVNFKDQLRIYVYINPIIVHTLMEHIVVHLTN